MLVMLRAALPALVSVILLLALVVFTLCAPKLSVVGARVMLVPVPVREIVWGLLGTSSTIVMTPVRVPAAVGTNVEMMLQLTPGPMEPPQVSSSVKSPDTLKAEKFRVAVPRLVIFTVWLALVVPIC